MSPVKKAHEFDLKRFVVGPLETNCYLVADSDTQNACLVDPGADPGMIKEYLRRKDYRLNFIINTHGHGDHIAANGSFDAPLYIHKEDAPFLADPERNLSLSFLFAIRSKKADRLLDDGERLNLGGLELGIIHTPGHTPGSISISLALRRCEGLADALFTGDTLFRGGVGRTDFLYGDEALLLKSIRERLLAFSDETVIYPGHGEPSTIGEERRSNPFLL